MLTMVSSTAMLLLTAEDCAPPPTFICFYVDDPSCNNLNGATLSILVDTVEIGNTRSYAKVPITGAANVTTRRIIQGEEVFYGFWSANGKRLHSYEEMYQWKYNRWPTPAQAAGITDAQVRTWFDERYTNEHWYGDEHPVDVATSTEAQRAACFGFTLASDGSTVLKDWFDLRGTITFANGAKCMLDFGQWDQGVGPTTNMNMKPVRVLRPCAGCN